MNMRRTGRRTSKQGFYLFRALNTPYNERRRNLYVRTIIDYGTNSIGQIFIRR